MAIEGIEFSDTIGAIGADELDGFFVGWKRRPHPSMLAAVMHGSGRVVLARDAATGTVVGFVTAITDARMAAYITLLEVLPHYRRRGIATELLRRMLDGLGPLYMVDTVCDEALLPFYERCGFTRGFAVMRRDPTALGGR